jgi:hypothetical protein
MIARTVPDFLVAGDQDADRLPDPAVVFASPDLFPDHVGKIEDRPLAHLRHGVKLDLDVDDFALGGGDFHVQDAQFVFRAFARKVWVDELHVGVVLGRQIEGRLQEADQEAPVAHQALEDGVVSRFQDFMGHGLPFNR